MGRGRHRGSIPEPASSRLHTERRTRRRSHLPPSRSTTPAAASAEGGEREVKVTVRTRLSARHLPPWADLPVARPAARRSGGASQSQCHVTGRGHRLREVAEAHAATRFGCHPPRPATLVGAEGRCGRRDRPKSTPRRGQRSSRTEDLAQSAPGTPGLPGVPCTSARFHARFAARHPAERQRKLAPGDCAAISAR
jgi:hypothetical protein